MRGPVENHASRTPAMSVATHWNGRASSSKVSTRRTPCRKPRRRSFVWMASPLRARATALGNHPDGSRPSRPSPSQSSSRRATPRAVGSWANAAPFIAPIEHPRTSCGAISCSTSERSMPTWTAPWLPPPDSTSATGPDPSAQQVAELPHQAPPPLQRAPHQIGHRARVGQVDAVAGPVHDVELAEGRRLGEDARRLAGGAAATRSRGRRAPAPRARWGRTAVAPAAGSSAARPPARGPRRAAGHGCAEGAPPTARRRPSVA